ncbi:unspecific monooxygenase [Epibacterium ulvae]|uniref:Unspecific monooxygenase n=1 Tax=Epibacterium ulvae TaxID=1156985 RepID=A0A1G5QPZ0_9RHOB|nr:cytochrome P450 [Epibacterium ulvae]SCZ63179.1 unspecific monooxygenase [Epibacterium ulvae]
MQTLIQSPTDPAFVQDPYPFYVKARQQGPLQYWQDYGMIAAFSHDAVHALLRDRRFGREIPQELRKPSAAHLAPFLAVEAHSMLEAEPPRHTRLRKLVMRAFTSREIKSLETGLQQLCHQLIDQFPDRPFDLLDAYCTQVPVIAICRLLGVPEQHAPDLLNWSHKMVAMYQASKTVETEHAAAQASTEFTEFLKRYIDQRRSDPKDDLITRLISAEEEGDSLTTDELIGTCILLLNAGHEATVHALGNGIKTLLQHGWDSRWFDPDHIDKLVEEILRFDPPLHMFTRYAYEEVDLFGHRFQRGDQVALMLGSANRDPDALDDPEDFDPTRRPRINTSFGAGLHFCVGAPLARLEMQIALPILFERCPDLQLSAPPKFSNTYHFHGLAELLVTV